MTSEAYRNVRRSDARGSATQIPAIFSDRQSAIASGKMYFNGSTGRPSSCTS